MQSKSNEDDPKELERRLEQASRIASSVTRPMSGSGLKHSSKN
jgi:hypothetical protein